MTARTNLVKSSLFTLGLSAALSAPVVGNAQSVILTGSGSSALLGNSNSVSPGAATGVKEPVDHSAPLIHDSTKPSDLVSSYVGRAKGILLARSDSGQGVRYTFNGERASSLNTEGYSFLGDMTTMVDTTTTVTSTSTQTVTVQPVTFTITVVGSSGTTTLPQTVTQQTLTQTTVTKTTITTIGGNPPQATAPDNVVVRMGADGLPVTFARYNAGIDLNPGFSDVTADLHF